VLSVTFGTPLAPIDGLSSAEPGKIEGISLIPHFLWLIEESTNEVVQESKTIVIYNCSREFRDLGAAIDGPMVIGLARALTERKPIGSYPGMCW
jgi:hypothetical protein